MSAVGIAQFGRRGDVPSRPVVGAGRACLAHTGSGEVFFAVPIGRRKVRLSGWLPPGCRLVFGDDVGGHAAAVLDVDALFPGPGADRGGVDGAGGAAAAGGSPGGAADLAGVVDVCPQRGLELVGVLSAQVDFIVSLRDSALTR